MNYGMAAGNPGATAQKATARPGQMTAVMRAAQPATGQKVLRIGLLTSGSIIEERIIKQRTSVTVGPSEKSTFVVQANVPADFKLFERVGYDYCLNFLDGMSGRVALSTGVADLAVLKGHARRVGAAYQVRLTDEARGKIVLGETTFLFQLVAPPPAMARPQLPLSVKGGLASQIDWTLTVLAAFSFLGHFAVVGGMYSDWMDPVVNEDISAGMVHLVQEPQLPLPVPVQEDATSKALPNETEHVTNPTPAPDNKPPPAHGDPAVPDVQVVRGIMTDITRLRIADVAVLASHRPSIVSVMNSQSPSVDINSIADTRVEIGKVGIDLPTDIGPVQIRPGVVTLPVDHTAPDVNKAGPERRIEVSVTNDHPITTLPATMTNLESVIRSQIFPRARRCYQHGLEQDQSQRGKLVVSIKVDPSGEVAGANVVQNTGLTQEVSSCIASAAKAANFGKNPGGLVQVPFNFVQQ
jgi:hypothetical protein